MMSDRQQAYLDAIGIEVWSLREPLSPPISDTASATEDAPGLKLSSGNGGILLVCAADVDSANRLANDISRALGSSPVWSWLDFESTAVKLADAIDEKLFTTVAIFGDDLAAQFFEGGLPASLNSANLVLLPSMQEIQSRADARKSLWVTLCRSGMVSQCDRQA
jgi:DNA polymerase III psi subunit